MDKKTGKSNKYTNRDLSDITFKQIDFNMELKGNLQGYFGHF